MMIAPANGHSTGCHKRFFRQQTSAQSDGKPEGHLGMGPRATQGQGPETLVADTNDQPYLQYVLW